MVGEVADIPDLRVGINVDIVLENEMNQSNAHFMKALVYDIEGRRITVSQTSPALDRHFLDRRIVVSFLSKIGNRNLRFGFPAKLIELISHYKIASGQMVEALVLQQHESPKSMDYRMYFRVKPGLHSNINLFIQDQHREEGVSLLDISLGGAKFICPRNFSFGAGDRIKIRLTIDRTAFDLEALVRDLWTPLDGSTGQKIQYVSIEFDYDHSQLETVLGKAIMDTERQLLSEGKI